MSNYKQGIYKPKNKHKYKGDVTNITYRSSWELKFMKMCDYNSNIIEWNSEEIVIPYYNPLDKKVHRYFTDFWVKYRDKQGKINKKIIEVKPYKETQPPKQQKRKTARYLKEMETFIRNQSKWKEARKYAKKMGMEFTVITEKELFNA